MFFLRLTGTPEKDIKRGTSLDPTGYGKEDESYAQELAENYILEEIVFHQEQWNIVLDGLCGYALDAETLEEAFEEAFDYIDTDANSACVGNRKPYIFDGEYSSDEIGDGDLFTPSGEFWEVK